uniref:SWI/SNF-related matrix-associated actin-dependent regulator of chromatin subfamily A-like protein 1 n=1 Tax=Anthurium amnicola TaxID=1678845 RepID=A0A1D1YTW9_9ARAE
MTQGEALSPSASHAPDRSRDAGNGTSESPPKLSVRLYLHASGDIAAKFPYHQLLVEAFRKLPRASWHAKERLWMFPASSLSAAEEILDGIARVHVELQKLDPLVHRALAAASAIPDLRDLYDRMPTFLQSKLLPFQRDGVRFVLHHGGRALLADEMGLGKTLQAIAVTACIRESWPVLILTPSSLRLHWASMIQHWLKIPSPDILVVLSQSGGSNRGGFNVVYSNFKASIHLDGVFNIISYDAVQKLHDVLMESEFKVVIADESHFLKNGQAKRTNASVPILQKAQYAILLSGTPALSRPIELFKQLQALYPDVYKNVHEYGNRYCRGVSPSFPMSFYFPFLTYPLSCDSCLL